jgi:lipid II:glycine glycyltransferase (peptidoglycan interpeptide bridge formation enzyme)
LDTHHQRYIRVAGKKGLTLREDNSGEGLRRLAALQENAVKRIQERGGSDRPNSPRQYQAIEKCILGHGLGAVFLAEKDGQSHSALLVTIYRQRAYLIFSGTSPEGYQLRSSVFLFWNTAMALKKRGVTEWNLGGTPLEAQAETSDSHGLFTFKERFGTRKVLCYSGEMSGVNKLRSAAIGVAKALTAWKN